MTTIGRLRSDQRAWAFSDDLQFRLLVVTEYNEAAKAWEFISQSPKDRQFLEARLSFFATKKRG